MRSPRSAISNRALQLKQAEIQAETDAATANAAAAGPLAQAAKDQEVIVAQEQVATRRAELKEAQLDTEVRRPADAARYAVEQDAAAAKAREIAEAEATSEAVRLSGEAERSRRTALAEAVRAEGHAEAEAILAKGDAEAQAMSKRADAYREYGDAAIIDIVAEVASRAIVAEAARPMSQIGSMTVVSTDGASHAVRSVSSTVAQSQELAKSLLGLDLGELVQQFVSAKSESNGTPAPAVEPGASPVDAADHTADHVAV